MTATEELRLMLDERGVEWVCYGHENHTWWNGWHAENRPSVNGLFVKVEGVVTPEQAVAATLGSGGCEMVRVSNTQDTRKCSACGKLTCFDYPLDRDQLNYCPKCGARVRKAVKR